MDYTNPEAVEWWHQQLDKVQSHVINSECPYVMFAEYRKYHCIANGQRSIIDLRGIDQWFTNFQIHVVTTKWFTL